MLTVLGLSKSGQMTSTSDLLVAELSLGSSNITGFLGIPLAPSEERWIWTIVWIVSGIAFCVDLVMLCLKQKQIRQATQVIKEAGSDWNDMPPGFTSAAREMIPKIRALIADYGAVVTQNRIFVVHNADAEPVSPASRSQAPAAPP